MLPKSHKKSSETLVDIHQAIEMLIERIDAVERTVLLKPLRIEIRIKPIDQLCWLEAQQNPIKIFGASSDNALAIAGIGAAKDVCIEKLHSYEKVMKQLRAYLSPQYPYMQWYGGFSFNNRSASSWNKFGAGRFIIPQVELARNGKKMMLACNLIGKFDKKALIERIRQLKVSGVRNRQGNVVVKNRQDQPNLGEWTKSVTQVLKDIQLKRLEKVVLARQTRITFKEVLNPWVILKRLIDVTPSSYHFAFQFGSNVFVGASPECLYRRHGRNLQSQALAGTKPRATKSSVLLNSLKDLHEHRIVVDAIKEALAPLSVGMKFPTTPSVVTLTNGHHLNTPFAVLLKDGVDDGDILKVLHPTPALGGKPKAFALKRIKTLEPFDRGWYAGPVGFVGLDWAEFVVAIRSGLINGNKISVFAGAGIVQGSQAADEWDEIENKISNFQKILT